MNYMKETILLESYEFDFDLLRWILTSLREIEY